jgi:energy-coupling factor transporter ATP-binding protein EcfA2
MADDSLKSPFKFLDPFEKKDRESFFGREKEVEKLYDYVNKNRVVLVYGQSGTGKTSIIRCGLANSFDPSDWIPVFIKRHGNLNESLIRELSKGVDEIQEKEISHLENKIFDNKQEAESEVFYTENGDILTREPHSINVGVQKSHRRTIAIILLLIKRITAKYLRPVYLVFDQFEELLIVDGDAEKDLFISILRFLVNPATTSSCHIIIVMREEYFAWLDQIEKELPDIADRRMRVEPVRAKVAEAIIKSSCKQFKITLEDPNYNTGQIIKALSRNGEILLPYLQVYLDQLWRLRFKQTYASNCSFDEKYIPLMFTTQAISEFGTIEEVLSRYMIECIQTIQKSLKEKFENLTDGFLYKVFDIIINEEGTKRPLNYKIVNDKIQFDIDGEKNVNLNLPALEQSLKLLEKYKILRDDGMSFELAHDTMGSIILEIKAKKIIRPKLLIPEITDNPYKGLLSYDPEDCKKFFGREKVVKELLDKLNNNNLIAVVGPSGAGKSSLIKAGLIPKLMEAGFYILSIKPEDVLQSKKNNGNSISKVSIDHLKKEILHANKDKIILYIDQFEQISTRFDDEEQRKKVINFINSLIDNIKFKHNKTAKIILSVRSDYEFEFDLFFKSWKKGKFNVPPFLDHELRDVIIEPAYYAGLEFSPDYLVDVIVREVQQSNGTLPLLSYTLSTMYELYIKKGILNGLLTEEIYNEVGGVIGGLQTRANKIYEDYPTYDPHRKTIRNVILRMITGVGERAGKKVVETDFEYPSDEENKRIKDILNDFIESRLIITGKNDDNKVYFEPAHDSLVRNWVKIGEWVSEKEGKDFFFYLPFLSEAVKDYKRVNKLWNDDPRLTALQKIAEQENSWLNKHEQEFVAASVNKREEITERRKNADKERVRLIQETASKQEKLNSLLLEKQKKLELSLRETIQEQAKSKLFFEQTIQEQAKRTRLLKKSRVGLGIGFLCLAIVSIIALSNLSEVKKKEDEAKALISKIQSLHKKDSLLAEEKGILADANGKLANKYKKLAERYQNNEKYTKRLLGKSLADKEIMRANTIKLKIQNYVKDSLLRENEKFAERVNLKDEPFFKSNYLDSSIRFQSIERLVSIKFRENDSMKYTKFRNSLNKLAEALKVLGQNPNKALVLANQANDLYPDKSIDSIGLRIANYNLFYTAKLNFKYVRGSSIYLTALSPNGTKFAFATTNGIRTGIVDGDSITLNKQPLLTGLRAGKNSTFTFDDSLLSINYINDDRLMALTTDVESNNNKLYTWNDINDVPKIIDVDKSDLAVISPNCKQLIEAIEKGKSSYIKIINIESLESPKSEEWPNVTDKKFEGISDLTYTLDGRLVLISTGDYKGWILNTERRTLRSIPDSTIYKANFTSDGKNIIYAGRDTIFIADLMGNKTGYINSRLGGYPSSTLQDVFISNDGQSLIVKDKRYGNRIFEIRNKKNQNTKLFSAANKDSLIEKSTSYGFFGFTGSNSTLSYTRSVFADSIYSFNILLCPKFGYYDRFSDAYASIGPYLTEEDKKDLNLIKLNEQETYDRALSYYTASYNPSSTISRKDNLVNAKRLLKDILTENKVNESYLNVFKSINRNIFEIDSNFATYANETQKTIAIEENLLRTYAVDTLSYKYKYYKRALSFDYGNLSYYLLLSKNTNYSKIIEIAKRGLALDTTNDYIYTNLALAHLLNKEFKNAIEIYKKYKYKSPKGFPYTFGVSFLKDFALSEKYEVISQKDPLVFSTAQKIKCWLKDQGCALN